MQHGSIPVELDPHLLSRALNPDEYDHHRVAEQFRRKIGWFNRWLECPTTVVELEKLMITAFRENFGVTFVEDNPTMNELSRTQQLAAGRYRSLLDTENDIVAS